MTESFPSETADAVHVDSVEAAHRSLSAVLAPTPLVFSKSRRAALKLENLQATGAYKVRGAFNAVATQIKRGDRRPLVAASAGNHGQGVAWAARHFGLSACIVVPSAAPETKVAGARRLGARVMRHEGSLEDCVALARELAAREGLRFVHPFDDPDVIAGQGTVAVELADFAPDVVVVPIGGGGLAAGMAVWLRSRGARVVGAQIEGVDAMRRRLRGEDEMAPRATIADGLVVQSPGAITTELCRRLLDDIVLVSEDDVRRTIVELALHDKLIVEGAGAVAVAALPQVRGDRRVAVVSGGNIDFSALAELSGQTGELGVDLPGSPISFLAKLAP